MKKITDKPFCIEKEGYVPVKCDKPLPCPFCGTNPELKLAHSPFGACMVASMKKLTGDTFWFECPECGCASGWHQNTALDASRVWNRRVDTKKEPLEEGNK